MRVVAMIFLAGSMILQPATGDAQRTLTGWTVTTNVTTDSGDQAHRSSMATRQQIAPNYLRMEYAQISGARGPLGDAEGMYMVFRGADTTLLMVMPQQRMATITGIGPMLGPMQTMMKDAARPPDSRSVSRHIEDLGVGQRILGHATRHFRVTLNGTITRTRKSHRHHDDQGNRRAESRRAGRLALSTAGELSRHRHAGRDERHACRHDGLDHVEHGRSHG